MDTQLTVETQHETPNWSRYTDRYKNGEWRAPIFCDMVLDDLKRFVSPSLTLLDIGCGKGFDDDPKFQPMLAGACTTYIGVEPDKRMETSPLFHQVHRCFFEDAPLEPSSIDLAFSVMVLEHLKTPQVFWDKLHACLKEGGVFWGFTIDARHPFSKLSSLSQTLKVKDWYLDRLHGVKGEERYENYPTYYRSNRPDQLKKLTSNFREMTTINFHRMGQMDFYLPKFARWIGRAYDRYLQSRNLAGAIMAVRVVK